MTVGSEENEVSRTLAFVEEADELRDIVRQVVESRGAQAACAFPRFSQLLTKYQEQSQLLDPLLDGLVKPLARLLADLAPAVDPAALPPGTLHAVARLLWQLSIVRGYKAVLRFFPNEVAYFETVVQLLAQLEAASCGTTAQCSSLDGQGLWEAQYVCLLWLALLVLIPFDLALVDSSLSSSAATGGSAGTSGSGSGAASLTAAPGYPPIVGTILSLGQAHLASPGSSREMAAVVLGRLITRPDMGAALLEVLDWGCAALQAPADSPQAAFLVPGVALMFATVFKLGKRSALLGPAERLLPLAIQLQGSQLAASNALARKLAVKLVQRIGLVFLRPRVASWRYQKPRLNMAANLKKAGAAAAAAAAAAAGEGAAAMGEGASAAAVGEGASAGAAAGVVTGETGSSKAAAAQPAAHPSASLPSAAAAAAGAGPGPAAAAEAADVAAAEAAAEAEAGEDVAAAAEQLEGVIEALLVGLADKDTVVRWSAAKGLGRLTMRLPKDLADEVVGSVLEDFFAPSASDTAWHGGCLAVAELASRGLLLPERLPVVAPLVVQALEYDVRRGPCSVGAHVRDAAAYVCWALARAYTPAALGPTAHVLAPALVTCSCYDREVNCRRAAAAAFQECVGRLGTFPHGIAVVTTADYFSVSVRAAAYLSVAPAVAGFPEYLEPLAWQLLRVKLRHWDKALRELAAQALAALVPHRPSFFVEQALPFLLPLCTDGVLEVRHGAVAGVAELLPALHASLLPSALPAALLGEVAGVIPAVEAARLTRGKGGEVMRSAICRLIEASAAVGLPLSTAQQACLWNQICDNLRQAVPDTQAGAAAALAAFAAHYLPHWTPADQQDLVLDRFLADLRDVGNPPTRRGAALALGVLPPWLLAPAALARVVPALAAAAEVEVAAEQRDAETRVNAVKALTQVALALHRWRQQGQDGVGAGPTAAPPAAATGAAAPPPPAAESGVEAPEARAPAAGSLDAAEVAGRALRALLAALGDYSLDNRGDVGSWVREAAMEGLAALLQEVLLPLASQLAQEQPPQGQLAGEQQLQLGEDQQEQEQEQREDQQQRQQHQREHAGGQRLGEVRGWVQAVIPALLKQAVERIARVREAAGRQLQRLLPEALAAGAAPAATPALVAALGVFTPEDFASLEALSATAALLRYPEYQQPLLEGLAFSIGGLDGQLSEAAAEALAAAAQQLDAAGCAGLAASLLAAWCAHAAAGRLCTPLLLTAEVLISRTPLAEVQRLPPGPPASPGQQPAGRDASPPQHASLASEASAEADPGTSSFPAQLLSAVREAVRGCTDIPRLQAGVAVLCQLASSAGSAVGREALRAALLLLANRYPKVRRSTAEQVYTLLLTLDVMEEKVEAEDKGEEAEKPGGGDVEGAMEMLLETAWDGPLPAAKAARGRVFGLLRLPPPMPAAGSAPATGAPSLAAPRTATEDNESYAALIDRAARGL